MHLLLVSAGKVADKLILTRGFDLDRFDVLIYNFLLFAPIATPNRDMRGNAVRVIFSFTDIWGKIPSTLRSSEQ